MLSGSGLIAAPYLFGLGTAAIVTGMALGALAIALGLAGTDSQGRGTLPVSAQAVYDRGLALGLFVVAALFGVADEPGALVVFAGAGAGALVVTTITRYSGTPV